MIGALTRRPWLLLAALAVLAVAAVVVQAPGRAEAHPLGNFTVNRYSRIEIYSDVIRVHYVRDLAEIPTFQEKPDVDLNGDDEIDAVEADIYARSRGELTASNLRLLLDGEPIALSMVAAGAVFPKGEGGLDTTRLSVVLETDAPGGFSRLSFEDTNYSERLGWKEIVVLPIMGLQITGAVPTEDVSKALSDYPDDLLSSPLNLTAVSLEFDASRAVAAPAIDASVLSVAPETTATRSSSGFSSLIDAENLTATVVVLALLAAFAFGAVHALEPGHGKTMVAAYFVGVKGGARQALTLGAIIAVTHSVGVLTIGAITIFGSQWILPERLYPWLTLVSGLMILALGLRLIAARGGITWAHGILHRVLPNHHHHHEHSHELPSGSGPPPWRTIVVLGLADGITPSPSALVVLLAAVSLDRVGLGIGLIVAFSVGLATVLAMVSLVLIYARQGADWLSRNIPMTGGLATRFTGAMSGEGFIVRVAPVAGACALVIVGVFLTARALSQHGFSVL